LAPRAGVPQANDFKGVDCQTELRAVIDAKGISPELANALEAQSLGAAGQSLYDLINGSSDTHHLDTTARLLWKGYGEGAVSDTEATYLSACIDRRRPLGRRTAPGHASTLGRLNGRIVGRFTSRQRQRSPDRKASRDRRRMLGGSSALPDTMRHHYTEGQRAVLCIVAGEIKRQGVCDMPIDKIAALAGVCRTTVQTAMHEGRLLGHVTIEERPVPGRKSLPNIVRISSREWLVWLSRGPSAASLIGSKMVKSVSTTKIIDLRKEEAAKEKDDRKGRGPPQTTPLRRSA
jgi:hypothetical protein